MNSTNKEELIKQIIQKEWDMFTNVNNVGGRASCQDDHETFFIMRDSQFNAWDMKTLLSYNNDLDTAISEGRNLPTEKYAYMMEYTAKDEYENIKDLLPQVSDEKNTLIKEILSIIIEETDIFFKEYPGFKNNSRPLRRSGDLRFTSIETYTEGELKTYSRETLENYLAHIKSLKSNDRSIVYEIYQNTSGHYGYSDLKEAERSIHH